MCWSLCLMGLGMWILVIFLTQISVTVMMRLGTLGDASWGSAQVLQA